MCPRSYKEEPTAKFLKLSDIKKIIKQAPDCRDILLHGLGEPLMNPDLIDIVHFLKRIKKRVHFATNAMLLAPGISEQLIRNGLDGMTISLNGATRERYEHIMEGANFLNVLDNIKSLVGIKKKLNAPAPDLSVAIVALKSNFKEIPRIIELAISLGVKKVRIRAYYPILPSQEEALGSNDLKVLIDLKNKQNQAVEVIIDDLGQLIGKNDQLRCNAYSGGIYITVDGWVTPCCYIYDPKLINFGNIFNTNYRSISQSAHYKSFRRKLLAGRSDYCKECAEYLSAE